jgi:hypothetical protein
MGGPYATVEGGTAESWTLTRVSHNTVWAVVEFDSKTNFKSS